MERLCSRSFSELWWGQKKALIWCLLAHIPLNHLCSLWMCGKPEVCLSGLSSRAIKKKGFFSYEDLVQVSVSSLCSALGLVACQRMSLRLFQTPEAQKLISLGHQTQTPKGHPLCGLRMPVGCGRMTRAAVARSRVLPLELAGLRIGWKVCLSMLAPTRQREDAQLATVRPFIFRESPNRSLPL